MGTAIAQGLDPHHSDNWLQIWGGDCRKVLPALAADSIDCVITSPPYWGLRDYGQAGQLGLERTPEEYVTNMVSVFREVRRVLKPSGTCWLNLGDSYAAARGGTHQPAETLAGGISGRNAAGGRVNRDRHDGYNPSRNAGAIGLKHKDLVGIPWRVAFALQADGWYLRSDVIWSKPNPMPESVTDRPTKSHEYVFLLTKQSEYFYDAHAIKEPISEAMATAISRASRADRMGERSAHRAVSDRDSLARIALGRNRRSVWTIPTVSYPGAHYATFPPKLVEPMILASTSEQGVCSSCGAPQQRLVKVERYDHHTTSADGKTMDGPYAPQAELRNGAYTDTTTTGWEPTCKCEADFGPAVVLDPFAGSGTVGMAANRLSRRAILIDLNPEYLQQQMRRNAQVPLGL